MDSIWTNLAGIRSDVHYGLGLVLAIIVTIHILLRKREVASAVGWIGLAWFAPILGAASYFVLGINRVQRRARRLRPTARRAGTRAPMPAAGGDDHLDPLARGIGRITGRPLLAARAIRVLHNGDEAYPTMLEAIAAARHSVGLSSYIFRDDRWGTRFIDALAAAKDRGVQVRVLVDGVGSGWLRSPAYHHLVRRGITAARFLHEVAPWRMPFLNLRSHKKILVVDGRVGFTGGCNIADQNVIADTPESPVQDTHFRIEGPVVGQLTEAFAQDWAYATDEDLDGDAWFPTIDDAIDDTDAAPARVIDSGPDDDLEKIEFAILQAVACARTRIMVMTPYFLPDERLISGLSMAAMRGVTVDVIIPQTSDHVVIDWATRTNIGPLLQDGVRLWRSPPPFRHSKVMLVDDEWCLVGSCNWDIRSFRLNFELCLEFYDTALAADLTALLRRCQANPLLQPEIEARTVPVRLRDAAARLALPYL
jgi:cardiolipin synthase